jgi:hypothetical protein
MHSDWGGREFTLRVPLPMPIDLLDATIAVDKVTERYVQPALNHLSGIQMDTVHLPAPDRRLGKARAAALQDLYHVGDRTLAIYDFFPGGIVP